MKINEFKVEQWMTIYEGRAKYNLTDTCAKSYTLQELLDFESISFDDIVLDYGPITGDDAFKNEILKLYRQGTIDEITIAQGCSQANDIVIDTLLDKGDHVITFTPGYQQFYELPKLLGCEVDIFQTSEENRWIPNIQDILNAIKDNTRMIIFNNPNNPTGFCLEDDFFVDLIDVCRDKNIYILCDEVYRDWSNINRHSISDLYELGVSTSSLSKYFGLAGLRIGWIKANKDIIDQINIRRDYSIISTGKLIDSLGTIALKHKDEILMNTNQNIEQNKNILRKWIEKNAHFHVCLPSEGTVCFLGYDFDVNVEEFCLKLLEKTGVFFVPGTCFGMDKYMRFGLARNPEEIEQGLGILEQFMEQFVNQK